MGIILVSDKKKEVKVKPLFPSVKDLAEIIIYDWGVTNDLLTKNCDKALVEVKTLLTLVNDDKLKTDFISTFNYKRKINKHIENLQFLQLELQFLSLEIESFIGNQVFYRAGLKMKLKDKKTFDDKITENREIAAMLIGLFNILFTIVTKQKVIFVEDIKEYKFKHELEILNELLDTEKYNLGYFATTSELLRVYKFT